MLAYVFWHRPRGGVEAGAYELSLREFHTRLAEEALDGVHGSAAFAVDALPWLGDGPGYEDWYLLEGFWALDTLNSAAATGRMAEPHGAVSELAGPMAAGLYRLLRGEGCHGEHARWSSGPPAAAWGSLWRRQMVLGPSPEFCLLSDYRPETGEAALRRRPIWPGP